MSNDIREYIPDVTISHFMKDRSPIKLIFGHVGSGKSSGCLVHLMQLSLGMPICKDKKRRAKWIIVRNTFSELKMTTLATFLYWFPEEQFGKLNRTPPFEYNMRFTDVQGVSCEFDFIFLSIDSESDVKKLLSLEVTGFYINELREIPATVLNEMMTRLGRFPKSDDLLIPAEADKTGYYTCIIADTNPPNQRHWIKQKFFDKPAGLYKDFTVFVQPPAMVWAPEQATYVINRKRENKRGIKDDYFYRQVDTVDPEKFKVYVLGEFGSVFEGKPVFPQYNSTIHMAKQAIEPVENEPLYIGFDFGLSPAAPIAQYIGGQFRILDELFANHMSLDSFLDNQVVPFLNAKYQKWYMEGNIRCMVDPAGGAQNQAVTAQCIQKLREYGIPAVPAPTNALQPRISAVTKALEKMVGGQPVFLLSPNCTFMHDALSGGYRYAIVQGGMTSTGHKYRDLPDKNEYSHIMDALQYNMMQLFHMEQVNEIETETYWDGSAYVHRFKEKVR
jgi:hypothetical protein